MSWNARTLRFLAGVGVLAVLGVAGFILSRPYIQNARFQLYLLHTAKLPENKSKPPDQLRVQVADQAAELGLVVPTEAIMVRRTPTDLKIDVRYSVRVDLPLYTVDLHFHPSATAP